MESLHPRVPEQRPELHVLPGRRPDRVPGRVLAGLSLLTALLVAGHLLAPMIEALPKALRRQFDLDQEANLSAWFSGVLLLGIAALASVLWHTRREASRPDSSRLFGLMALVFVFLSADEVAQLHESVTQLSKGVGFRSPLPGGHGAWIFLYPLVFLIVLAFFRKSLRAFLIERPGRSAFLAGATLFVVGAVGIELVGYYVEAGGAERSSWMRVQVALEEGAELLGEALMICGLLTKVRQRLRVVSAAP